MSHFQSDDVRAVRVQGGAASQQHEQKGHQQNCMATHGCVPAKGEWISIWISSSTTSRGTILLQPSRQMGMRESREAIPAPLQARRPIG